MRIIELGTFLLPVRFSLGGMLADARNLASAAIQAELSEFSSPPPLQAESGLVLDYHRSIGARRMETMLYEGAIETSDFGTVRLYVSSLSVCFFVANFDVADGTVVDLERDDAASDFKEIERALTRSAAPLVAEWSARIHRAIPTHLVRRRPQSSMSADQILWWHRIAIDPPSGSEFPAARRFGVTADLGDGARCTVGNGFSNFYSAQSTIAEHVVEGLMVATQEWIIVDEAQRLLADHLMRLSQRGTDDLVTVDHQYGEMLELTQEVTFRKLVLSEEQRYLANVRIKIKDAAGKSWRTADEANELEGRTSALRDLFLLHRERITNDRDERRNRFVFVITSIALIQSVQVWYDFVTEPNVSISQDPRPIVGVVAIAVTLLTLLSTFGRQLRDRSRSRTLLSRPAPVVPHQISRSTSSSGLNPHELV